MPLADIAAWFTQNPDLGEILDRQGEGRAEPVFVSASRRRVARHRARLRRRPGGPRTTSTSSPTSSATSGNTIPALVTVLTRPRELTRKQLRELRAGARPGGLHRGESRHGLARDDQPGHRRAHRRLHPPGRARRPAGALRASASTARCRRMLRLAQPGRTPQRQWLQRIAAQTKANVLVDREALDDPDLVFKREGGGFARLDTVFGGELAAGARRPSTKRSGRQRPEPNGARDS